MGGMHPMGGSNHLYLRKKGISFGWKQVFLMKSMVPYGNEVGGT